MKRSIEKHEKLTQIVLSIVKKTRIATKAHIRRKLKQANPQEYGNDFNIVKLTSVLSNLVYHKFIQYEPRYMVYSA